MMDTSMPCGLCVVHAVRVGVSYADNSGDPIIGQKIDNDTVIHGAVVIFAGTPVCWYHVDDVAKAAGL